MQKIPDAFFNSRTCNRKELLTFSVGGANFSVIMERDSAGSYKIKADGCASFFQSIGIKSYDLLVLKYMGKLEFEVSTLYSNMFDVSHMWIGGDQFCRTEAKNENVFGPSSKYVFATRIEDAEAPRKVHGLRLAVIIINSVLYLMELNCVSHVKFLVVRYCFFL